MKAIFTLFTAAVLLSLTSCKKDYTCTCSYTQTYTYGSSTNVTSGTETRNIKKAKKSDANMACTSNDYKNSDASSTYSYKTTCSLN